MSAQESNATREAPAVKAWDLQLEAREGRSRPYGVAERSVVPMKPGNAGGGKGPWLKASAGSDKGQRRVTVSLTPPASVQKLQAALHAKAKGSPSCRFHALYDKVYRKDVLAFAYDCCKSNKGAAGVDGQTFEDIESKGLGQWLGDLTQELKSRTYRPAAVRRVHIPKPDGKTRPLGIPTVRDRVVQSAAMLVMGPVFEADLQPEQYAYRPQRSALDAVSHVYKLLNTGHQQIVDADLSGYFDSIPHAELMRCVARRVCDGAMLHLIKMWLEAPVEETDQRGGKQRTTRNKDQGRGTPQGAPITPPTIVQNAPVGATFKRAEIDPIYDFHLLGLHLDALNQCPNDLSSGLPIRMIQACHHFA
jgi:hypothetical protein